MERKFLDDLGLAKEVVDKVLNQHGSEIGVLKTQATTQDQTIKTLRTDLITEQGKVAGFEKIDIATLEKQLSDEKDGRKKDKKNFELTSTLSSAGCSDIDYAIFKLGEKADFDESGKLKNPEAFLITAKETCPSVFINQENNSGTGGSGNFKRSHGTPTVDLEAFKKMSYEDKLNFKTDQPDEYNSIKAEITKGFN